MTREIIMRIGLTLLLFILHQACLAKPINKINLNQATEAQLTHVVKGLGKKRIRALIEYRKQHGAFRSFQELSRVKGLSKPFVRKHMAELERYFTIGKV